LFNIFIAIRERVHKVLGAPYASPQRSIINQQGTIVPRLFIGSITVVRCPAGAVSLSGRQSAFS
jgi:hypothetical protein